jgi:flagellar biosynthetic protein FliQ
MLLTALAIGLLVGMFQAATQVNEMTLSFIPKLLSIVFVLFAFGPWILSTMISYTTRLITEVIPAVIG